jgi:hypothetical protein
MATDTIAARAEGFGQRKARMLLCDMEKSASTPLPAADHVEHLLDSALEQTFPASDPVAVDVPRRTEPVPGRLRQLPWPPSRFTSA